jgi:hypothetical protein
MDMISGMYHFKGFSEFNQFSNFIEEDHWKIEKQLLKDRVFFHRKKKYFLALRKQFIENKISIWELKDEEVVTWIDTLLIMRRMLFELFKRGTKSENAHVIMEYPFMYGNHMRTDYMIVYDRLVIILEFGMFNQDERRGSERYTKKLHESIGYQQILRNIVNKQVDIVNYVMIYRPEFDRSTGKNITENNEYNQKEIALLTRFVELQMKRQDHLSAIHQLEMIETHR